MRRLVFWRWLVCAVLILGLQAGAMLAPALAQESGRVYALQVDGLACPFCAYGIEKQLSAIDGVGSVETDIKSSTVTVTMDGGATLEEAAAGRAVEAAGFTMGSFTIRGNSE